MNHDTMNKEDLYSEIISRVPVKGGDDFRKIIRDSLSNYRQTVERLDEAERPDSWDAILVRLKQLCEGINRAIDSEFKGLRHSAYASIKNQLDGYRIRRTNIPGLARDKNILTVIPNSISYRMRKVSLEEQKKLKEKDLFHIPLDDRTKVSTQRYSVPGYPCLYLAHRIYGCWEEMGRPDFGATMVSAFKSTGSFKLLDMRIPTKESWKDDFEQCVLFFPLIISTMVQVNKTSDPYKPEYTIPQILTEWVISTNNNKKATDPEKIIGIAYTSAQKNDEFDYPLNSYDNYAIPVLKPLASKNYCKKLTDIFRVTKPTYYDLEVLRQGGIIGAGEYGLQDGEEQKTQNIKISPFGKMEDFVLKYPFKQIDCQ